MLEGFSLKEAAAIAELPESVVRTAVEKKVGAPRAKRVGRAVRYTFDVKELFYIKLL
jgi:DNA-directed RNA polymerase specialized sigma24 family protein